MICCMCAGEWPATRESWVQCWAGELGQGPEDCKQFSKTESDPSDHLVTSGRLHLGTASSPKVWVAKKSSLLAYMELTLVILSLPMFSTGSSGLSFVDEAFGEWQREEGILAMDVWPWLATGRAAQTEESCLCIRDITKQEETSGKGHQANSTEGQRCEFPPGFFVAICY